MRVLHSPWHVLLFVLVGISILGFSTNLAFAKPNPKYAGLVVDAETGQVLYQENAGKYRYPASLTKLMTLYLTFEAIEKRQLRWGQMLKVSSRAARQPRSKIYLKKGSHISVRDAVMALIIKSANDAAVVLAEALQGSEWQFAVTMTQKARALGMKHTTFRNASGLHHRGQRTTAYDMARLAMAMRRDFPRFYSLFSRDSFHWDGKTYRSYNQVTKKYPGADGLKTGFTNASGYNLITTARKGQSRVVAVVLGGRKAKSRNAHMVDLLNRSFRTMGAWNKHRQMASASKAKHITPNVIYTASMAPIPQFKPKTSYVIRTASYTLPTNKTTKANTNKQSKTSPGARTSISHNAILSSRKDTNAPEPELKPEGY